MSYVHEIANFGVGSVRLRLFATNGELRPFANAFDLDGFGRKKYVWLCVVRGEEESGPKVWCCGRHTQHMLLDLINENLITIPLPWYVRFWNWVQKRYPQPTTVLDPIFGKDLIVDTIEVKAGDRSYFKHDIRLAPEQSTLGTPEQMKRWLDCELLRFYPPVPNGLIRI